VARKVLLKPGEEVIDVGSGFGGFMIHAQERFGVRITAVNTTSSQAEHAQREIERRRLGSALQVMGDFRDERKQFDKVCRSAAWSTPGRDSLAEVIGAHARFLKPGGLGLIHFIGHVGRLQTDFFIRKYVFPGGWIPSLADVVVELEKAGLEVRGRREPAPALRAHARCLAERFDQNWDRIRATRSGALRRALPPHLALLPVRLRGDVPLAGRRTHLFQIVFSKGNVTGSSYPMTREFLYEQPVTRPARGEKRSSNRAA